VSSQQKIRTELEGKFKNLLHWDITAIILEYYDDVSVELIKSLETKIEESFDPRWEKVHQNFGGTTGLHHNYIQSKIRFFSSFIESSSNTEKYFNECVDLINSFWLEWAGYQVTHKPEYIYAL
jgi:hypothetical protein